MEPTVRRRHRTGTIEPDALTLRKLGRRDSGLTRRSSHRFREFPPTATVAATLSRPEPGVERFLLLVTIRSAAVRSTACANPRTYHQRRIR
jgi:hypothetical protein